MILEDPKNQGAPSSVEGNVLLRKEQKLATTGVPSSNAVQSMEVVKDVHVMISEGMNVPGYMAVGSTSQVTPDSGVKIFIETQPLYTHLTKRASKNETNVERVYDIEKGLVQVYTGKPLASPDVTQVWVSGRHTLPEDETAKLTRIKAALDAGLMTRPMAIMELYNLPHVRAAIKKIEQMDKQNTDFPPPTTQAPKTGLQARGKRQPVVAP